MVRQKQYLDIDVLAAAKERIRHIYDTFDSLAVCFSGGKDSLATLHLTWEVAQEIGLSHVDVIFRDEELIPDAVIDFVNEYRQLPWVRMLYFAVPLASTKYILGRSFDYIQWDPGRRHMRPVPDHAITLPPGDERTFDQYSMDSFAGQYFKGRIAFVTGIRAAESLIRFRASVNKLNENYINATAHGQGPANIALCKPLYDWQENDVFRYFYEREIRYCALYDAQHLAGDNLRVSTPLHAESAKRFGRHRTISPVFYQQVVDLFPEMLEQERYFAELDNSAIVAQYGRDMAGVKAYILEELQDEHQQEMALKMWAQLEAMRRRDADRYPPEYVLKYFMAGQFKRLLLPLSRVDQERRAARVGPH